MPAAPKSPAAAPAPGSKEKLDRLRTLLHEMFQFDRGDLDFGLYRIMRMKATEIKSFLDDSLLPQVQEKLQGISAEERERLDKELSETLAQARDLGGFDPEETDKVKGLRKELKEAQADAAAEADVYNHLANFFSRYYSEGDFMSLRRYSSGGKAEYLIPYNGEEVKLHWANADQYYIKTTENYASYVFAVGGERRVRFEITAAENNKDNVKESNGKQRRFVLAKKQPITTSDSELIVRFEHRPLTDGEKKKFPGNGTNQQNRINADADQRILNHSSLDASWRPLLAAAAPTQANGERTVLARHLERYTAKNSFDYFIHKDLGGFLRRELDLYLKNEVLNLDDLDRGNTPQLRRALARMRATRFVAEKIITFLAQLEDFQKQLWLKKKFVLETQYCITLDRVPEELYSEIIDNTAQIEEWKKLFFIHETDGDLSNEASYSEPLDVKFLQSKPYLVVDTRHFDANFTERLLTTLSDKKTLDDQLDGLLIHGENFQALNLLKKRYYQKINCIYIDPPYNTGDSEILYKNGYLRSSWLALMANRLTASQEMLSQDSVLYIAVDDFEMANLSKLVDTELSSLQREMIIVNHHPQGGMSQTLAHTHDYMLACVPKNSSITLTGRPDGNNEPERRQFRRAGTAESNFRRARPDSFYAILVNPETREVMGLEPPPREAEYPLEPTQDGWTRIYPIDSRGTERVWRRTYQSSKELVRDGALQCTRNGTIIQIVNSEDRATALFSNWTDARHNAGIYGANLLGDILGERNAFSYPKSVYTVADAIYAANLGDDTYVMDYFAGSGTTGHAVINLNREDNKKRRFILVEMGNYFDRVMMTRIKKALYSEEWREGQPTSSNGYSCLFKYIRLESYEDTLDNLVLSLPENNFMGQAEELSEDYQLRYALPRETANSPCLASMKIFDSPHALSLITHRNGTSQNIPVDLPETFNYLIGLQVESQRKIDGVLAITGTTVEKQRCLILWRDYNTTENDAVEAWFTRNRNQFAEPLDVIYINGDHTLNAIRLPDDRWEAKPIEPMFRELMFAG